MPSDVRFEIEGFPPGVVFQRKWRTYQERVLSSLDTFLSDKRVHIVAAPGSGKTVLGLEIVRRINQRALILAPTLTIRDQWIDRFTELFLRPDESRPPWISSDIRRPQFVTVSTYQALHSLWTGAHDSDAVAENNVSDADPDDVDGLVPHPKTWPILESMRIRTLVVDEAHHLHAEWWKALCAIVERFDDLTLVALTATPPYDVSAFEWRRYEDLCGTVDAEVSVPELVQKSDLCPHQDYVYFTIPASRDLQVIDKHHDGVSRILQELQSNREFGASIAGHPWLLNPRDYIEAILDNPSYVSSMLVYLNSVAQPLPPEIFKVLGVEPSTLPRFDASWAEILLTGCLYVDHGNFSACETTMKPIRRSLQSINAVERRKVKLLHPSSISKLLTTNLAKLDAIVEIAEMESRSLGDELRLVVLADYIRMSELPIDGDRDQNFEFEDIGVVPIFERLRVAELRDARLGVLTGSLVILPSGSQSRALQIARESVDRDRPSFSPLKHDGNYCVLEMGGNDNQSAVRLLTQLFSEGAITVLVGTKSLLGEGWDAPSMNALILASFVGTYVTSNQMRGRAIRTSPVKPDKTANIWHLVCIDPSPSGPGDDYETLRRRFKSFVGVCAGRSRY